MIEALSTLRAPVWLLALQDSLLDHGAVGLCCRDCEGGLLVHVDTLVSCKRGSVIKTLPAVAAGVGLAV